MTKDEVALLVDLIQSNPIITSKETNASTNKLKYECWISLTNTFNAKSGQIPRKPDQLKLKWDNLKKAARKRAANIRMNNLQTGGGKPDFIPPDETLDKVASLLGSTCSGFDVPVRGDGVGERILFEDINAADETAEQPPSESATVHIPDTSPMPLNTTKKRKIDFSPQPETSGCFVQNSKNIYGMTSMSKSLQSKAEKFIHNRDDGRRELNLAMAKYYEKKTEKLDIEIKILKLELAFKENNGNN
ncbi:uncharacterized protein LOC123704422 [Colias croceus]|uniref:uncharacterized protein LOC123704422 n=1 Tax=Colias crocea TaxID=72248 RepID=UPI001E2804D5|nr:uncharacterized protein LOC123704422 [Colias croceus]